MALTGAYVFSNGAQSTAPSAIASGAASIVLQSSAAFPTGLTAGQYFVVRVDDAGVVGSNKVAYAQITGNNVATNTLTVGSWTVDGSTAQAFGANALVTETLGNDFLSKIPQQVQRLSLGVAAASITFAIPGGFSDLEISWYARGDATATDIGVTLQLNADATAADYVSERMISEGTAAPATFQNSGSNFGIGDMPAASSPASYFAEGTIRINNYTGSGFKSWHGTCFSPLNTTGASSPWVQTVGGLWASTAALTQVVLGAASGSFLAGTVAVVRVIP